MIDAIAAHIEKHLGPIDFVFHEVDSHLVHIDVHHVPPTPDRPFHTLVTTGMSGRPMSVPEEPKAFEGFRYAELMLSLPPDWPLDPEVVQHEEYYWPIRWLIETARFPHRDATWLGPWHTVAWGESLGPNTSLCGFLVVSSMLVPDAFHILEIEPETRIRFYALLPLHADELDLKIRHGTEALLEALDQAGVEEIIDPERKSAAGKRRWWS